MQIPVSVLSENQDLIDVISQNSNFKVEDNAALSVKNNEKSIVISENNSQQELNKPYHINELFSILYDMGNKLNDSSSEIKIGDYIFIHNKSVLFNDKINIDLTEKEADVIKLLIEAYPDSMAKEKLLHEIWGYSSKIDTHTLETHIYRLRKKIPGGDEFIVTQKDGYTINSES